MNLYLIQQDINNDYDTYDRAVVIATSEEEARTIHPAGYRWEDDKWSVTDINTWCHPEHVTVKCIGITLLGQVGDVICASFNAG